jgi:hypothetical protein
MNSLSTNLADYEFHNGVLEVKPKSDLLLDKAEMELMLKEGIGLTKGEKYYALIDTSNNVDTTVDARNYYSTSELSKYRYADAFVIRSLPIKIVFNFYLRINKPPVLTKMFNDRESAMEWLLHLKVEAKQKNGTLTV